jgi:hypothetical protein
MYPFYIPSIYRHDSEFLIKIRDSTPSIKYYIIIAKNQYKNYAKVFPSQNLVILPESIIKISEIRQFILELARKNNESKIWMSDDDLSKFFIKQPKNTSEYILKPIDKNNNDYELKEISFTKWISNSERIFDKISILDTSIVQFGFKYSTFAIPTKPITLNTNIGMIQLLDIEKTKGIGINYDTSFITLEDTDFTVQLFHNKLKSCQLNHFIFTAPKSGSGKGGLEVEYSNGAKQKGMSRFLEKYPKLIEIEDLEKGKYKIKWNFYKTIEQENKIVDTLSTSSSSSSSSSSDV